MKMEHIWGRGKRNGYFVRKSYEETTRKTKEQTGQYQNGWDGMEQDNIKMDGRVWTGSFWVGITTSGRPLLT
jgi:hypothetical protein